MTDEQIIELMEKHFHIAPIHDNNCIDWFGETNDFMKFAQAIHRQTRRDTLHEIIARLSSAPNAEVNQYAIILTEKQLIPND